MAFKPLRQQVWQDTRSAIIDNSQVLSIGEAIIPSIQGDVSVVLTAGGTDGLVLGVVLGFKDKSGNALEYNTYTAENDNVTDKIVKAIYVPAHLHIDYESDLDADAETTDNSGAFAKFTIDATGLLADESTVTAPWASTDVLENMQLFSYGLTGKDTTQIECRFINTIWGYDIA